MEHGKGAAGRRMITEVWNNGNLDMADECLHPEYVPLDMLRQLGVAPGAK